MTAAVPVPKTSLSLPASYASATSWIAILRSVTLYPLSRRISIIDFRVMPERMLPSSSGVTTSPSITKKMFIAPTSPTYFFSTPSSQRTCE